MSVWPKQPKLSDAAQVQKDLLYSMQTLQRFKAWWSATFIRARATKALKAETVARLQATSKELQDLVNIAIADIKEQMATNKEKNREL